MSAKKHQALLSGVLLLALCSSCAAVKPWEREHLADPTMSFEQKGAEQLVFEAREGSAGGSGEGGGGCACKR